MEIVPLTILGRCLAMHSSSFLASDVILMEPQGNYPEDSNDNESQINLDVKPHSAKRSPIS